MSTLAQGIIELQDLFKVIGGGSARITEIRVSLRAWESLMWQLGNDESNGFQTLEIYGIRIILVDGGGTNA